MTFHRALFWTHLAVGLLAGLLVAAMALTGTALAFEQELVAWAERDGRRVEVPSGPAPRLSLEDQVRRFREAEPSAGNPALTVSRDPAAAVIATTGRDEAWFLDPYTGKVRRPATRRMRAFMRFMTDAHRGLALQGSHRALGRALTGAGNLAFALLCLTGLVLGWPRTWTWPNLKRIAVPALGPAGRARDFNWHVCAGVWMAPVLLVITATAVPMSYRWASDAIYRVAGEEPPAPPGSPLPPMPRPGPHARPVPLDAVLARAEADFPRWEEITLRSGGGRREAPSGEKPTGPQPLTLTLREASAWPRMATATLVVDPFTGEVLRRTPFADLSRGRRIRTWMRYLHTGQALGRWGQLLAAIGCMAALLLVYTGAALSWRRFVPSRAARVR